MKSSQVSAQRIADVLEQTDDAASIEDVCRRAGISIETYYHWYKKYGALRPSKSKRLRELEDENSRLKLLIAILSRDKRPMRDVTPGFQPAFARTEPHRTNLPTVVEAEPRSAPPPTAGAPIDDERGGLRLDKVRPRLARSMRRTGVRLAVALRRRRLAGEVAGRDGSPAAPSVREALRSLRLQRARGQRLLLGGIAAGLIGGFAFGMHEQAPPELKPLPVDMTVRFNSYRSYAGAMEQGWKKPEAWGAWMDGKTASVLLGFDGPARADVELLVEARARAGQDGKPATIIVRFNDAELAHWRLPAQPRELRRRFIVPAAVFNRTTAAQLRFEVAGNAPTAEVFGLQRLSLRDATHVSRFRGYLDHCDTGKVVGWAVAEDAAVSVVALVDGQPVPSVIANVERKDLAGHGLPDDAGFELLPTQPIAPGSTVEVRFANGQPLIGSPCRP